MIRIRKTILALITLATILGGIALSALLGFWITENTKQPAKIKTGDFAGQADPADIRGSYTFADIEKAFAVPADILCASFSSPEKTLSPGDKVNVLESFYAGKTGDKEIGTDSVRLFVALAKKIPYVTEADTGLPPSAIRYLIQNGMLTKENAEQYRVAELESDSSIGGGNTAAPAATGTSAVVNAGSAETHTEGDKTVTGSTTFADLLSWGLTSAEVEAIVGFKIPALAGTTIKDAATQQGKSFGTIKTALQELINKKN